MQLLEEKSVKSCKNLFRKDDIDRRCFGLSEQLLAVREQSGDEDAAEEDAADEFTGADGQCQEPECARDCVGIAENQRDDDAVRDDRAECAEEAMLTECVGSEGTEQGSEGAEDDVRQGASGQDVREEVVTPGIAAGVKNGRMVSTSEKRTWMAPLARSKPAASAVSTM